MKKGISYWAFPGGLSGEKPLAACFREARSAGFEGVELALGESGELNLETDQKQAKAIARLAAEAGVEIASLATGLWWQWSPSSPEAEERAKARQVLAKGLELAAGLGTDAFLVIPGAVDVFFDPSRPVVPYDQVYQMAREAVAETVPLAEKLGVSICVENVWNRFLLSPLELRDFLDGFASPRVGAYLDVGNCMLLGYPEQWIRILGQRIRRVHLKDFRRAVGTADGFVDLLCGDVNWPAVITALQQASYDGYLTAEVFPYHHYPEVLLANASRAMDAIIAGARSA